MLGSRSFYIVIPDERRLLLMFLSEGIFTMFLSLALYELLMRIKLSSYFVNLSDQSLENVLNFLKQRQNQSHCQPNYLQIFPWESFLQ